MKEALLAWDSTLDEGKKLGDLKNDIVDFTEIVLKNNNFEFDGKHFVQKLGTRDSNGAVVCQYFYGQTGETVNYTGSNKTSHMVALH